MMRSSVLFSTLLGSLASAQSTTVNVWGIDIVRRFDQTMVGSVISMDPSTTVLAYSCPDEFGCGTATISQGPSTWDATLTTSEIPGQAGATQTEMIHCQVTPAQTKAACTQSFVTVTNGATATALVTKAVEDDFADMAIVVPADQAGSTEPASTTAKPTSSPYSTYIPDTTCTTPITSSSSVPSYSPPPVYTSTSVNSTLTPITPSEPPTGTTSKVSITTSVTSGGSGGTTTAPTYGGGNGTTPTGGSPGGSTSAPPNAAPSKAAGLFAAVGAAAGAAVFAL